MRVTKDGDSIGVLRRREESCLYDVCDVLPRKAVHHVDVDAFDARATKQLYRILDHRFRLDAIDALLHVGIQHLNTETGAGEAGIRKRLDQPRRNPARVKLDGNVCERREVEARTYRSEQLIDLLRRENVRGPAAKMYPGDTGAGRDIRCHEGDLRLQRLNIRLDRICERWNGRVAATVPAELLAEGNVKVERNGRVGGQARTRGAGGGGIDVTGEPVGRRIARVPRQLFGGEFGQVVPNVFLAASAIGEVTH